MVMNIVVDNTIVKSLAHNPELLRNTLIFNSEVLISFRWGTLLEFLDLGSIFSELPIFGQNQPLFEACILTLHTTEDKEALFHVYDNLFVENLNQVKALPQINAPFILQAIQAQRESSTFCEVEKVLSPALDAIQNALVEKTSDTMHDLILYLAWDRMCVWMGYLFNHQSVDPKYLKGIDILKGCLIESYQHILEQRRTKPSFYRMMESLFFYQMREENLMKHTDAEWMLLSQSFPVLKSQDELVDFFYIDDAIISEQSFKESLQDSVVYLTVDSPENVKVRLELAQYMIDKIKAEVPRWNYALVPKNIINAV